MKFKLDEDDILVEKILKIVA